MCWSEGLLSQSPVIKRMREMYPNPASTAPAAETAPPPLPATPLTGTSDGTLLKRLITGKIGEFAPKVREAGLGTSVKPKPIGSLVRDITRQN